ncbi:hypothetical protein ACIBQX_17630 [Nonomuraea sp. NPDC049714]
MITPDNANVSPTRAKTNWSAITNVTARTRTGTRATLSATMR